MLNNCAVSSNTDADDEGEAEETPPRTMNQGMAHVYPDEDAAIGAFRFAERYSMHYIRGTDTVIPTAVVLDVARELQKSLATPDGVARPAPDHVLCSSANSKRKPCSAGKLWKRAEEMRKADMHDAAGADLLRALLKSGLEADFVQRCERGLQWAFGSIRRQREREAREAIEEAKLEQRRQEEREAMEEAEGRKREYEADFVKFGRGLGEVLRETLAAAATSRAKGAEYAEATVDANGSVLTEDAAEAAAGHVANNKAAELYLIADVLRSFTVTVGLEGGIDHVATLALLRKVPPASKTVDLLLIEARCHEVEGHHRQAMSAAGKLIAKAANKYEPWRNDDPKMMATTLGSNAAMQLGLSENAISFYQNVLKFDPEQERARKQYRGLKKVVKLLKQADEQIQKG